MNKILFFILLHLRRAIFALGSLSFLNRTLSRIHLQEEFSSPVPHEDMLSDAIRMNSYHQAITKHVQPGDRVIDLGTGTGILAFFAAARRPAVVYAIDHSSIIDQARLVALKNNVEGVAFVRKNSADFDLDEPVDAIIQEQMGELLFDERMVPNVVSLRDRLLKKGGKILPAKFELFVEPVKLKDEFNVPFIWELNVHGIDFSCLKGLSRRYRTYDRTAKILALEVDYFLCQPEKIYAFDLATIKAADRPARMTYSRKVIKGGRLDGFLVYFNVIFDDEIRFSTWSLERPTSWGLTLLRTEGRPYAAGERLRFFLAADEWENPHTWWWAYR